MTWWRGKHPNLLTMAHAKTVGERAAKILRDHRDGINDAVAIQFMEALARDPYAVLITNSVYEEASPSLRSSSACAQRRRSPRPRQQQPRLRRPHLSSPPRRSLSAQRQIVFRRPPITPRSKLSRKRSGDCAISWTSCRYGLPRSPWPPTHSWDDVMSPAHEAEQTGHWPDAGCRGSSMIVQVCDAPLEAGKLEQVTHPTTWRIPTKRYNVLLRSIFVQKRYFLYP